MLPAVAGEVVRCTETEAAAARCPTARPFHARRLIYIVIIQRGPVVPCSEELSPIQDGATKAAAVAALLLPLLVLLPYPAALSLGASGLPDLPPTF